MLRSPPYTQTYAHTHNNNTHHYLDTRTMLAECSSFGSCHGDDCHTATAKVSASHSRRILLQVSSLTTDIDALCLCLQM